MFLFIRYWFIYNVLLNCNSKQTQSHTSIEDGTVSYLDVHVLWIDRQTPCCSGCQTLWAPRLTLEIITQAVNSILAEYGPEYGLGWVNKYGPMSISVVCIVSEQSCYRTSNSSNLIPDSRYLSLYPADRCL